MTAERATVAALAAWWDREDGMQGEAMAAEIWEPPGLPRLKAGDRVQIHRSAECPEQFDFMHAEHHPDGTTGTVRGTYENLFGTPKTGDGHDVLVWFGSDSEGREDVSWFAASELIPLDCAAIAATSGDGEG